MRRERFILFGVRGIDGFCLGGDCVIWVLKEELGLVRRRGREEF